MRRVSGRVLRCLLLVEHCLLSFCGGRVRRVGGLRRVYPRRCKERYLRDEEGLLALICEFEEENLLFFSRMTGNRIRFFVIGAI